MTATAPDATDRNQTEVRDVILGWIRAIEAEDRAGILARHAPDILMFDLPGPIARDLKTYEETWDFFFRDKQGPIVFRPSALRVVAGDDVAFASCLIHCEGTSGGIVDLRLTMGLQKRDGIWTIVHEHHSVPSDEGRFQDPALS